MPKAQNWFHHTMVSRIWITYLKYDSQSEENEPERTWHQPQTWSFYLLLERTSYSRSYVPTIKFDLEQLPPTKTSGNGSVSCKKSCYRIRVSLALCLSFWLFTFIYLEIGHWKRKKNLLDLFLSCLVILQNVYPCIKHNNLFYYIYVITSITKVFPYVFLLLLPVIFAEKF